jgi:hypothetical protein
MLRIACHRGGLVRLAEVDPDIEVVLTVDGSEEAVLRNLRLSFLGCDLVSSAEAKWERPERLKGVTALEVRGARDDDADQDAAGSQLCDWTVYVAAVTPAGRRSPGTE